MKDLEPRLARCIATVFPDLNESQIRAASLTTVPQWDSVAAITLLTLIEEEFATPIDLELLVELNSFSAIAAHLASQNGAVQ